MNEALLSRESPDLSHVHPIQIPRPSIEKSIKDADELSAIADDIASNSLREHLELESFSEELLEKYGLETKEEVLQYLFEQKAPIEELESVLWSSERFFTKVQLSRFLNGEFSSESQSKKRKQYTDYYIEKAIEALNINTEQYLVAYGYNYAVTISQAYKIREYIDEARGRKDFLRRKVEMKPIPAIIAAIINQKGGASKTTTTQSLAAGIACANPDAKILMIDADHQCTLTDYYSVNIIRIMGWDDDCYLAESDISIGDVISCDDPEEAKVLARKAVRKTPIPNLFILPARRRDTSVNNVIYKKGIDDSGSGLGDSHDNLLLRMEHALSELVFEFDYIFIDLSPQVSNLLSYNSLAFAHTTIVPFACTRNDVQATCAWLAEFSSQVRLLEEHSSYGFVSPPMILRANYRDQQSQREIENSLINYLGSYFLSSKHKHSEAIASANMSRQSIFEVSEAEMKNKSAYKRAIDNTMEVVEEVQSRLDGFRSKLLKLMNVSDTDKVEN